MGREDEWIWERLAGSWDPLWRRGSLSTQPNRARPSLINLPVEWTSGSTYPSYVIEYGYRSKHLNSRDYCYMNGFKLSIE